jgi:hypothetical protein
MEKANIIKSPYYWDLDIYYCKRAPSRFKSLILKGSGAVTIPALTAPSISGIWNSLAGLTEHRANISTNEKKISTSA